jgi:hypothetical protein
MSNEAHVPRAADILSVKSRVSWGAIAAGAMVALTIYLILSMLGVALGIEIAMRHNNGNEVAAGTAIYAIITLLLAMFFGGWATSRLAVGESKTEAVLYGLILWGVLFLGMVWLAGVGIRTGFTAMVGTASGVYSASREAVGGEPASSSGLVEIVRNRYDNELGNERFIDDLKKAGLSDDQAKKAQAQVKAGIDRVRNDVSTLPDVAREVASKPEVRQTAVKAADVVRMATWWTLAGMVISLLTVIFGALIGSGEVLQPVPILGVRRPRPTV